MYIYLLLKTQFVRFSQSSQYLFVYSSFSFNSTKPLFLIFLFYSCRIFKSNFLANSIAFAHEETTKVPISSHMSKHIQLRAKETDHFETFTD